MKKEQHTSYLIFILVLSVLAIIFLAIETFFKLDESTAQILNYADNVVCAVFFLDFLFVFFRAENKVKYFITWGWLDLLSSVPAIPALRVGRATRIIRIFRVFRGIKSAKLIMKAILEKKTQSASFAAILVAIILVVVSSISILHFESATDGTIKTAEDAIWWSIVTITTVGYGDKYPITTEGRFVAAILMFAGVGLFGAISGFVTSWFISPSVAQPEQDEIDIHKELKEIKQQLSDLKRNDIT